MQQQVKASELLKEGLLRTAETAIELYGHDYLDLPVREELTEEVYGVKQWVIGISISQSDDSSTVYAFQTKDKRYLEVQITSRDYPFSEETCIALISESGVVTQFNHDKALYANNELMALLKGETTEGRIEQDRRFEVEIERGESLSEVVIIPLPISDTDYVEVQEGYKDIMRLTQEFDLLPSPYQQVTSLLGIARVVPNLLPKGELWEAVQQKSLTSDQMTKINDWLEQSFVKRRLEIPSE